MPATCDLLFLHIKYMQPSEAAFYVYVCCTTPTPGELGKCHIVLQHASFSRARVCPLLTLLSFGRRGVVESLQRVAAALLQDVIEVEDEHHDHALLVLHRDDVGGAEEV